MLLFLFVFLIINIFLLGYCKLVDNSLCIYDTRYCRDVRVTVGLVSSSLDLESRRRRLVNSKF